MNKERIRVGPAKTEAYTSSTSLTLPFDGHGAAGGRWCTLSRRLKGNHCATLKSEELDPGQKTETKPERKGNLAL